MKKSTILILLILIIAVAWTIVPFLYLFSASITGGDMLPRGLSIPSEVSFENYRNAIISESILPELLNSLLIGAATTLIVIVFSVPAAYGFARINSRFVDIIFYFLLVVRMVPDITFAVPIYFFISKIGLMGNPVALCLVYSFWQIPFSIWLLRPFIAMLPYDIEEAAMLDGASQMQVLWKIITPLLAPALSVVSIFTFLACYIEYLYASLLTSNATMTLPVRLAQYSTMHKLYWGPMSAAVAVSLIPMIIIYVVGQKYIVRGLTLGAIK